MKVLAHALRFVLFVLVASGALYSICRFAEGLTQSDREPGQQEPCRDTYYDGDYYREVTCKHSKHRLVIEDSVVRCLCERNDR